MMRGMFLRPKAPPEPYTAPPEPFTAHPKVQSPLQLRQSLRPSTALTSVPLQL